MAKPVKYVVCTAGRYGPFSWYTGKAGEAYLSRNIKDAFIFTQEDAAAKAESFARANVGFTSRWYVRRRWEH